MPDSAFRRTLIGADVLSSAFDELDWAEGVDAHSITITRSGTVVTISGSVADSRARNAATAAILRTRELGTLDNQLTVGPARPVDAKNTRIAQVVESTLLRTRAFRGRLRAEVSDHVVTLSGTVDWEHEREAVCRSLDGVADVHHVVDRIHTERRPSPDITTGLVQRALASGDAPTADVVHVSILDSEVTLTGLVQSAADRSDAEHAAWSSPHVTAVHNNLTIRPL